MTLRIALGHVDVYDDRTAAFARQLGLGSVQLHNPTNLTGVDGVWTVAELTAMRERCEADGLVLEGLENVPHAWWDEILTGGPGRDDQLDRYCRTIRNTAAAGITVLGHHFMPTYVWRTALSVPGRGGATVTAYDEDAVPRGNALADYPLTPTTALTRELDHAAMRRNYEHFLAAALPVAEEVGVVLSLHPDDPPTSRPLGGAARLFSSPAQLAEGLAMAGGSPSWRLTLCLGSVSEMQGEQSVLEVIDHFGAHGAIGYVHFRDVDGVVPRFAETFLGAGNFDPVRVVRRLRDVGFGGFLIDDHVPALVGDDGTWGRIGSEAFCSRGRAHALGYLQGVLAAVDAAG